MKFNGLISKKFKNDSKILEAGKLIDEAIESYRDQIAAVKPPREELKQNYNETIESFNRIRGGNLYFPYLGSGWGRGPLVELLDGSIKYDMISGIGPHFWGHCHPPLMKVAFEASLSNTIMQGHLQQNYEAYLISDLLIKASQLDHCFLSSSGAMANENALKLIFQKQFPANRVLAFDRCFMGRTIALSQITDKPAYREGLPHLLHVDYLPFYRPEDPEGSIHHTLNVLHHLLARYPKQHAAMCFELIQGEAGFHAGSEEFFKAIMEVLKEQGIQIFIDEVQTFGRTPKLFAFQYYHLEEYVDVVSIGKLSQVCATLFRSHLKPKSGLLSQTFTSSTVALQTSYWIIEHLLLGQFFGEEGKICQLHRHFVKHLEHLEKKYPDKIKGPYGIGAMVIFTPLDGNAQKVAQFVQDLFHEGVISFIAGSHPTRVRFLIPAGVMTFDDIDQVMKIVEKVLKKNDCHTPD